MRNNELENIKYIPVNYSKQLYYKSKKPILKEWALK